MAKENAGKVAVTFLHIAQRGGWKETRCGGQALPTRHLAIPLLVEHGIQK